MSRSLFFVGAIAAATAFAISPAFAQTAPAAPDPAPATAPPSAPVPFQPPAAAETSSTLNPSSGLEVDESGKNRPATGFGRRGQLAISTDFQLSFGLRLQKEPADQEQNIDYETQTILRVAPTVDYFLADHFSVGASFLLARDSVGATTANALGGGVRAGYNIPLGDRVSFWPRGGGQVLQTKVSDDTNEAGQVSTLRVRVVADAPVLFHPVPHFFVGAGPAFGIDVVSKLEAGENAKNVDNVRQTDFAVTTVIGGWF
jgi:hypothetical protein